MTTSPNPFADEPLPQTERLQSAADPLNPYAAPVGVAEYQPTGPGVGAWRNGELVVIHESVNFPERCIWTNQETNRRFTHHFTYGSWIGIDSQTISFDYSFSAEARQKVVGNVLASLGMFAASLVFLIGLFALDRNNIAHLTWLSPIFMITMMLGFGMMLRYSRSPLALIHHEQKYYCIRGAKEPFLRSLPKWPGLYDK
jgi:hypothetical protein